jgi:RNA polymerase sigma factor (sigma-70 family)
MAKKKKQHKNLKNLVEIEPYIVWKIVGEVMRNLDIPDDVAIDLDDVRQEIALELVRGIASTKKRGKHPNKRFLYIMARKAAMLFIDRNLSYKRVEPTKKGREKGIKPYICARREMPEDVETPEDAEKEAIEVSEDVQNLLDYLLPLHRQIVCRYWGIGCTRVRKTETLAKIYGVTQEAVETILKESLAKMKHAMENP